MTNSTEIKKLGEFQLELQQGKGYTGLVESIGYVHWKEEVIYFEQINADKRFEKPVYKQLSSGIVPGFYSRKKIVSKHIQRMCVMSREQLRRFDNNLYFIFYDFLKDDFVLERDAIDVHTTDYLYLAEKSTSENPSAFRQAKDVWSVVDNFAGGMEAIGLTQLSKWIGYGQTAITLIFDTADGEYLDAAGNLIIAFTPGGFWIDLSISIATAMYNTDFMQSRVIIGLRREIRELEYKMDLARTSGNDRAYNRYERIRNGRQQALKKAIDDYNNRVN